LNEAAGDPIIASPLTWKARLRVPHEEIAVLGDMGNDLEMFRKAGFAIAMGNAAAEVKRAADVVTLSNKEGGWALAIERHILAGL
jgi:hydroxymethylpyrimidine pyrophosphatase-like HAD family hydrolase